MSVDGARNLAGVTAQALNKRAGAQFVLIPSVNINNGLQDTITGRTQAGVFSASIVEAHVRSGALRAIATASTRRLVAAPEVPAAAETLPGFDFSGWFMVMAPTGTPADIVKKLNGAIDEATRDAQVRELAPKLGFELDPKGAGTPEAAEEFLQGPACALGEDHPGTRHRAAIGRACHDGSRTGIRSVAIDVCALDEAAAFYAIVWRLDAGRSGWRGARYFRGTAAYHHILSLHRADTPGDPASGVRRGGSGRGRGAVHAGAGERRRDGGAARTGTRPAAATASASRTRKGAISPSRAVARSRRRRRRRTGRTRSRISISTPAITKAPRAS